VSQPGGTVGAMSEVMVNLPVDLIAERHRLGLDRFDEVWEGEYHMAPFPTNEHRRILHRLDLVLSPPAEEAGLEVRLQFGLYDPDVADHTSYRGPDLVVFRPEHATERGVEGRAELVVEIRSPDDETYQKIPFYQSVGVQEVLVVDRDTKALRHWTRAGDQLVEADTRTGVSLRALDVRLRTERDALVVEAAVGSRRV
jgi:hypothetical protein